MQLADGAQGRDAARRSTLDVIMDQIRRKRAASDRKPLGRFLSRGSEQAGGEERPHRGGPAASESERELGWGRVCAFLKRLGTKTDTRSLSLAHSDLIATDLLELGELLQFFPQLEELDVSWNELIGSSLPALTFHLQQVGGVRTLLLCGCRLNADDIAALGEALGCLPVLEVLDVSWNSSAGGGALQGLVGKLPPSLKQLHLVACQLTAADAAALGEWLRGGGGGGGSALGALDLSRNPGLSGALGRVAPHLAHLSHLESLELHGCRLSAADLDALVQVLPALTALTELDLSANGEVGGVAGKLLSALPLTQMRRLPLSCCNLTEDSLAALGPAVPFLRSVDVSGCQVVGGRLASLLEALLQPSVVQELRLSSCELTSADLCELASACERGSLSSLRLMDLSFNGAAEDAGWSRLFSAGGLSSLEELDVSLRPSGPAPGSRGGRLAALLGALPRLPSLSRLAVRHWSLGPGERRQLAVALRGRSLRLEAEPAPTESAEE